MPEINHELCECQGDLFELAADKGYDIRCFSNIFLGSDFCMRAFDSAYSRYQCADAEESLDLLEQETASGLEKASGGRGPGGIIANWTGYIYRVLCQRSGMPSREILKRIPPETVIGSYYGYHTLDEEMAADKLLESAGINKETGTERET